jgi:ankyrin repeat protein
MTPAEVEKLVGWTSLHRAAFRGDFDAARALLDSGAEVDPPTLEGWTPLMSACLEGRAAVAKLLRDRGARAELPDYYGASLATLASASGDLETARIFSPKYAPRSALFFLAAHARAGHAMKKLRDRDYADGDMVGYSMSWNEQWAIRTQTLELDDHVMAYVGDVRQLPHEDAQGSSASDKGLCIGMIDIVLADDGMYPMTVPLPGLSGLLNHSYTYIADLAPHLLGDRVLPAPRLRKLLEKAAHARHPAVVDAILPETGKTLDALFTAVLTDDPDLVARLIDDPNVEQTEGFSRGLTALGYATQNSRPRAARVLLQRGADVERGGQALNLKDGGEMIPLHAALNKKTGGAALEVISALLEYGANVEATRPSSGTTVLMSAVSMGDAKIVERLLRAGANPNARDKFGRTPLSIAHSRWHGMLDEHPEIVELLLAGGAVREP